MVAASISASFHLVTESRNRLADYRLLGSLPSENDAVCICCSNWFRLFVNGNFPECFHFPS